MTATRAQSFFPLSDLSAVSSSKAFISALYFNAAWAPPCSSLTPIVQSLATTCLAKAEPPAIKFYSINVDDDNDIVTSLTDKYDIQHVPTIVFIHPENNIIMERIDGYNPPALNAAVARLGGIGGEDSNPIGTKLDSKQQPIKHLPQLSQEACQYLHQLIHRSPIMVFMKGSPDRPQCGFTRQLLSLFDQYSIKTFGHFDILGDEEARQSLKVYSEWPTFPQVYVHGRLIGGLDITRELLETGEWDSQFDS